MDYEGDIRALAAMGWDGVKFDGAPAPAPPAGAWRRTREPVAAAFYGYHGRRDRPGCGRLCNMTMYAELMNKTGKSFAIENCHWGDCTESDDSSCPTTEWW